MPEYSLKNYKISLVFLTVALSIFGILVIGSAEKSVQRTQIIGLILGIVLMFVISLINYQWFLRLNWLIYAGAIALLLATLLFGDTGGGAQRWIDLKFIRFQPSELCKVLLILFFAQFLTQYKTELEKAKTLLMIAVLMLVPLGLVLKQPDLSTTIVFGLIFLVLLFIVGISRKKVLIFLAVAIPLAVIMFILVIQPGQKIIDEYQQTRILAWMNPEEYADADAMQQQNSITAIGSGQLEGKGLNNEEVASLKNGNFVPAPQTDFIFAVIGEELGFIGCCAIVILLLLIVLDCIFIGNKANDESGKLICYGIASWIGFQSIINISVTTGLIPNTGVTLPFVSYGLTSLVSLFMGIGFVLNVGLQPKKNNRWRLNYENRTYRTRF